MSIEAFYIITLDNVILLIIGPVFRVVHCFKFLDYQHCTFKQRQLHYASFGRVGGRCCRKGQQRHEELSVVFS